MPPITPTPITYNEPWVKSNKWELNMQPIMFWTTTMEPIALRVPLLQNNHKCETHIKTSNMQPKMPI
jgi:hypothetical protein